MYDVIRRHKQGLEAAIRATTARYDISVVFEGTRAYTEGTTIVLPNVDVFAMHDEITDEVVEDARAYFMALKGYAWHEAGTIVETDNDRAEKFQDVNGSFANMVRATLDDIRVEHRFGKRGPGIAEAMIYMREQWVWPRFARKKQQSGTVNLFAEAIYGLQVMMKHYEERHGHVLWQSLSPEAQTFVERSIDDLDSAHDTLKMESVQGTERLCDVVKHMLERWHAEWTAVAPLLSKQAARKAIKAAKAAKKARERAALLDGKAESDDDEKDDALAGLDQTPKSEAEVLGEATTDDGVPPFLLVTYGKKVATLQAVPFADGFVHHVETVPIAPDGWKELHPLADDETRTLVILPPDPELEKQLNELLANYIRALISLGNEIAQRAEEELQEAEHKIQDLPDDERPYLVYTTANDQYVVVDEASLRDYSDLQDQTKEHVGLVKKRLEILLRTQTRRRLRGNQESGVNLDMPDAMSRIAMSSRMPRAELRPYQIETPKSALLDVVCALVTDVSGSMNAGRNRMAYQSRQGSRRDVAATKKTLAKWATLCFAEALSQSSIRFGAWAFSSNEYFWEGEVAKHRNQLRSAGCAEADIESRIDLYGRYGATYIETIKSFDEPWAAVKTRLPNMGRHNHANYDADSVYWVGQQLLAQRAKRRVLWVLCDGLPDTNEPTVQVARQRTHLKKVVAALTEHSVEVVAIGICDDHVKLYYPYSVVIWREEDLPRVLMNEMDFLLLKQRRH